MIKSICGIKNQYLKQENTHIYRIKTQICVVLVFISKKNEVRIYMYVLTNIFSENQMRKMFQNADYNFNFISI